MIQGYVKFEKKYNVKKYQQVIIIAENAPYADTDSIEVAKTFVKLPKDFDFEYDLLPFTIDVYKSKDYENLLLRAHMPFHSGTDIRIGDLITTESIPARLNIDVTLTLHTVK